MRHIILKVASFESNALVWLRMKGFYASALKNSSIMIRAAAHAPFPYTKSFSASNNTVMRRITTENGTILFMRIISSQEVLDA